jgi:translocation and assembly module TamA
MLFQRALCSILLAGLVTVAQPAQALELFGRCLFGDCKQAGGIELIDPLEYDLTFKVEDEEDVSVQRAVEAASELYNNREEPVSGATGLLASAKGDYRRILAALYNRGHYGPSISITIDGQQASTLRPGAEFSKRPQVLVAVESGAKYNFGEVEIVNAAPPTDDVDDEVRELDELDFKPGRRASASTIRRAGELQVLAWREQGYAKARVANRQAEALHRSRQLDVLLRMEPGRKASFGGVSVEGTERMDPAFVAYMTGLVPGEEYDPDTLARARRRLERLGVFSLQRFREADRISANGLLPIDVIVKERKQRRIGVGATLSSIDGAGVEAFWLHRNLFGKAESLRISGAVEGIGAETDLTDTEELDYKLDATLTKPGLIDPDTDLVLHAFARKTFNDTFEESSIGAEARLNRYLTDRLTVSLGAFTEYGNYDDAFGERQFGTAGLDTDIKYDLRDNPLDPTQGAYFAANVRPFYEWEFDNAAIRAEGEARGYLTVGRKRGRTVLAARAKVGTIVGAGIDETPPDQLFLAGGGGSVRGYGFKNIGTTLANGEMVGGQSLVEGSVELRQRIGRDFGAVIFADAGVVGEESFTEFNENVKASVGVGGRYYTSLGPIRVDVAVPLNPQSGDPAFGVYAGIGHAF